MSWTWKIQSPVQRIATMTYFPKVAVVITHFTQTACFRLALAGLEMAAAPNPNATRFLIWSKEEADRLVEEYEGCQAELSYGRAPYELQGSTSLQFYDVDNLEFFELANIDYAKVPKLDLEQIADQPDEGAVKPKVLFLGMVDHMPTVITRMFGGTFQHPNFRTYGYGQDPDLFDHYYHGEVSADIIIRNRSEQEYCFDMVVQSLALRENTIYSAEWLFRDQRADIDWADSKLRPGGLYVLYGKCSNIIHHVGTLANRFTDFSVSYPEPARVVIMCRKKHERSRDDKTRDLLAGTLSFSDNKWDTPDLSFTFREKTYSVMGDPRMDPVIFTRWPDAHYMSRFCGEYPFASLRKIFKRVEEPEPTTLLVTPSVTNLTKLRLRGLVKGKDGAWIVTKQTDETVTSEQVEIEYGDDGEEVAVHRTVRTRKRVRQVSLVLTEPTIEHENDLHMGDVIVVDAA